MDSATDSDRFSAEVDRYIFRSISDIISDFLKLGVTMSRYVQTSWGGWVASWQW